MKGYIDIPKPRQRRKSVATACGRVAQLQFQDGV